MRAIRELPPDVVNKIAAGEVVERPASAVKEMLENCVDAGAGQVVVDIVEGGRDLIRVVDDGCGIPREQLPLAVRAHATSKLASADDLFRIASLGFRGEALSSIAGVSDFSLRSRPPDQAIAAQIEVRQGIVGPVVDCAGPLGTQIEVRNLFASLPVRRKFLKTKQTELGHISDALTRIALAAPALSLRLTHNDRVIVERPGNMDQRSTIGMFFGRDVEAALLPFEGEMDGVRVHGWACDPRVDRPNNRTQFLFVNGRFFRDRSLGHALNEAYRGLLMTGRYPIVFAFIEMPPDAVDVNVHPMKTEVRFQNPHLAFSLLLNAIKSRFLSSDLVAKLRVQVAEAPPRAIDAAPSLPFDEPAVRFAERKLEVARSFELASPAKSTEPVLWSNERPPGPVAAPLPLTFDTATRQSTVAPPLEARSQVQISLGPPAARPVPGSMPMSAAPWAGGKAPEAAPLDVVPSKALQLHNSYLVVETEDGMLLVDQHALHERILYEELRNRVGRQALEVQELLVPEPVELTPLQIGLLLDHREMLERVGIRVADFGPRCLLLRGYPAVFRKLDAEELLRSIADHLEETGKSPSRDQMLEEMLHLVACKAAVKAGDPLEPGEIDALLARRGDVDDSHHCPHGRPTVLKFTLRDLERQFKRT